MVESEHIEYDEARLKQMNDKALENQFFTPDNVYMDLGLIKDIPLGCVFMDYITLKQDEEGFTHFQKQLEPKLKDYQTRCYDTVNPYLSELGYTDDIIDNILAKSVFHDYVFMLAPMTKFFNLLIRHTIRNQNHSKPANKFTKKKLDTNHYILEPIQITYRINTYPLKLSPKLLEKVAMELGESFGVNIAFMCKDPALFDKVDWDEWMEAIDCFYIDSLGRFGASAFFIEKQGSFQFNGAYFFVRKRFERHVEQLMRGQDFEQEIQVASTRLHMFCEFEWLQNNDLRLTEEGEDVPMTEEQVSP